MEEKKEVMNVFDCEKCPELREEINKTSEKYNNEKYTKLFQKDNPYAPDIVKNHFVKLGCLKHDLSSCLSNLKMSSIDAFLETNELLCSGYCEECINDDKHYTYYKLLDLSELTKINKIKRSRKCMPEVNIELAQQNNESKRFNFLINKWNGENIQRALQPTTSKEGKFYMCMKNVLLFNFGYDAIIVIKFNFNNNEINETNEINENKNNEKNGEKKRKKHQNSAEKFNYLPAIFGLFDKAKNMQLQNCILINELNDEFPYFDHIEIGLCCSNSIKYDYSCKITVEANNNTTCSSQKTATIKMIVITIVIIIV